MINKIENGMSNAGINQNSEKTSRAIESIGADVGAFIRKWRKPALSVGLQMLFLFALTAIPGLAQNPWGGSGTTKLANAGSNTIVVLTWISLFIAIVAAISIGVCVYFEMNYKKNIIVALFGLGGFAILGSIAYDIVNLNSITMTNPTLGN